MSTEAIPHAPILWAQTKNLVYLTIGVQDVKNPDVKFSKNSVYFKVTDGEGKTYEETVPVYGSISPEDCKVSNSGRNVELKLVKQSEATDLDGGVNKTASSTTSFWPSLTSDMIKCHWIKCDFTRFQDEEDSDEERFGMGGGGMGGMGGGGEPDFSDMMRDLNALNTKDGNSGGGGAPNFDDLDDEADDSDDEPIPDLEN